MLVFFLFIIGGAGGVGGPTTHLGLYIYIYICTRTHIERERESDVPTTVCFFGT